MKSLKDNQIDKSKGLIWYKIFSAIMLIRIFVSFSYGFTNVFESAEVLSMNNALFIKTYPYFSFSQILLGLISCGLSIIIFVNLIRYQKHCIILVKYLMVFTIATIFISSGAWYIDFSYLLTPEINSAYYQDCITASIGNLIMLLPTYYYLKTRFI